MSFGLVLFIALTAFIIIYMVVGRRALEERMEAKRGSKGRRAVRCAFGRHGAEAEILSWLDKDTYIIYILCYLYSNGISVTIVSDPFRRI